MCARDEHRVIGERCDRARTGAECGRRDGEQREGEQTLDEYSTVACGAM